MLNINQDGVRWDHAGEMSVLDLFSIQPLTGTNSQCDSIPLQSLHCNA